MRLLLFVLASLSMYNGTLHAQETDKTEDSIRTKELEQVIISGQTETQRARSQAYNVTAIDAKKLYNTSSDINQVLSRTTGVKIRETGGLGSSFTFLLNGFSGKQVKFFLDGVPLTNFGSSLALNNIPINMAERIEVYKGVVPVHLGSDALGGAVNIITNQKSKRYVDASYSFGSFNTHRVSLNTRMTNKKGLTFSANAFGNYSDNNYRINVSIADPVSGVFAPEKSYRHFHDKYENATMVLEGGLLGKKWADRFLAGVIVSGTKDEIQQGSNMQKVVGMAHYSANSVIPILKYQKENFIIKKLSINIYTSYNRTENKQTDTSSRVYDWEGNYSFRNVTNTQNVGELNEKTLLTFKDAELLNTLNINYEVNANNAIGINNTFNNYTRDQEDPYKPERFGLISPSILKNILGAFYRFVSTNQKFSATAFGKSFIMEPEVVIQDTVSRNSSFSKFGYGAASSYYIKPNLQVKVSYENTYRLPEPEELLGGGILHLPNPDLRPEHSNNINIGATISRHFNKHFVTLEVGYIFRRAKDFIREYPVGQTVQSQNLRSVSVSGFESVIRYNYNEFIFADLNLTYQNIINTDKFDPPGSNFTNFNEKLRIPNLPFLFGNGDINVILKKIKYSHDQLILNAGTSYVEGFYLSWPSYGAREHKKSIPTQVIHNIGVTYSMKLGKYNISLECRNLTDVKAYDFYRVQKPGRSFACKLRYFFN